MKVIVLQHVAFEDLGSISAWLRDRRVPASHVRLFAGEALPDPADDDVIVALGGPMSAAGEAAHPWLRHEKAFLRLAVERGSRILGICLGAQLIANALGARVYPAGQAEVGWFPVARVGAPKGTFAFLPSQLFYHWHNETFDLPPGAVHLARSEACLHQAFQLGPRIVAVQFHPEMTAQGIAALDRVERATLAPGRFVQAPGALGDDAGAAHAAAATTTARLLEYLVAAAPARVARP